MVRLTKSLKFPDRKISDTLLLFADPLTTALGPNPIESQFRDVLALSWLMWNAVVYADVAMNAESLDGLHRTMRSVPEARYVQIGQLLIERSLVPAKPSGNGWTRLLKNSTPTASATEARMPAIIAIPCHNAQVFRLRFHERRRLCYFPSCCMQHSGSAFAIRIGYISIA